MAFLRLVEGGKDCKAPVSWFLFVLCFGYAYMQTIK